MVTRLVETQFSYNTSSK